MLNEWRRIDEIKTVEMALNRKHIPSQSSIISRISQQSIDPSIHRIERKQSPLLYHPLNKVIG